MKPVVNLAGQDGNVFNLLGICSRALKSVGERGKAQEMGARVLASGSYGEALRIMLEYVSAE
jgi:hypothetical protein